MTDDTAVLRVLVTTALGAVPLEDAAVTVSTAASPTGERALLYAVQTDRSGMTPPMELAAPPRANSLTPNGGQPYALYTVEVRRDGYVPLAALNVTMFSGVPSVLPVSLTPLPENAPVGETQLQAVGDPQALTQTGEEGGAIPDA